MGIFVYHGILPTISHSYHRLQGTTSGLRNFLVTLDLMIPVGIKETNKKELCTASFLASCVQFFFTEGSHSHKWFDDHYCKSWKKVYMNSASSSASVEYSLLASMEDKTNILEHFYDDGRMPNAPVSVRLHLKMSDSDSMELPPIGLGGLGDNHIFDNLDLYSNGLIEETVAGGLLNDSPQALIEIVEQPQSRVRFRYSSEGKSHGGMTGENSTKQKKTFPALEIKNYNGPARVVVSLVTDDAIPKTHAHELVGKNCDNGLYVVELPGGENMKAVFPNLSIQHVTKKNVPQSLAKRIEDSKLLQKKIETQDMNSTLNEEEKDTAMKEAQSQANGMELNVVRMCFQAYLKDENGQFSRQLPSVISNPIYDSKSPAAAALKICRLSRSAGSCKGGDEIILLCEKVQKDDVKVVFSEYDEAGNLRWQECGDFGPNDVHKQYAIAFKTPPYDDTKIKQAVKVQMHLRRVSSPECRSPPWTYVYHPEIQELDGIERKRKKSMFPDDGSSGRRGFGGGAGLNILQNPGSSMAGSDSLFFGGQKPSGFQTNTTAPTQITPNKITSSMIGHVYPQSFAAQSSMTQNISSFVGVGNSSVTSSNQILQQQTNNQYVNYGVVTTNSSQPIASFSQHSLRFGSSTGQLAPTCASTSAGVSLNSGQIVGQPTGSTINSAQALQAGLRFSQVSQPGTIIGQGVHSHSLTPRGTAQTFRQDLTSKIEVGGAKDNIDSGLTRSLAGRGDLQDDVEIDCEDEEGEDSGTDEVDFCRPSANRQEEEEDSGKDEVDFGRPSLILKGQSDLPCDVEEDSCPSVSQGYFSASDRVMDRFDKVRLKDVESNQSSKVFGNLAKNFAPKVGKEAGVIQESHMIPPNLVYPSVQDIAVQTEAPQASPLRFDEHIAMKLADRTASALYDYAVTGNISILLVIQRHLVSRQDEYGDSVLHIAVIHRRVEVLGKLLEAVATLDNPDIINQVNNLHQTCLHLAVLTDQPSTVTLLLSGHADPSLVDRHGNTPLHLAAIHGKDKCLKILLRHYLGVLAVNIKNYDGMSALHIAARGYSLQCLRLLAEVAEVNLPDGRSGRTALHHAVETNNLAIIGHLLIEAGADVNQAAFDGNSALHIAVGRQLEGASALLMAAGADPRQENMETMVTDEDEEGIEEDMYDDASCCTSLDVAQLYGNERIVSILNGEPYQQRSYQVQTPRFLGNMKSSIDSVNNSTNDSGIASSKGDLHRVDVKTRMQLSRCLDQPETKGWRELARCLGLECYITAFASARSPTHSLLDQYEEIDGTVHQLKAGLLYIKRADALHVLQRGLQLSSVLIKEAEEKQKDSGCDLISGMEGLILHEEDQLKLK